MKDKTTGSQKDNSFTEKQKPLPGPYFAAMLLSAIIAVLYPLPGIPEENAILHFSEEIILPVPYFAQGGNSPWADHKLGTSSLPLRTHGCILICMAMVINYHGINTDPGCLNTWLKDNCGYLPAYEGEKYLGECFISWEAAIKLLPELEGLKFYNWNDTRPDYSLILDSLKHGNPVIAETRPEGKLHFIVIYGCTPKGFLIHDPDQPEVKVLTVTSSSGKVIYGVRILY